MSRGNLQGNVFRSPLEAQNRQETAAAPCRFHCAMRWAVSTGLPEGSGGKIHPAGRATRAEEAAILMRFHNARRLKIHSKRPDVDHRAGYFAKTLDISEEIRYTGKQENICFVPLGRERSLPCALTPNCWKK